VQKKLYVANLSWSTSDESLKEAFSQVGSVLSANIIVDRETGKSRGFAFVEMSNEQEASEAISKLNGLNLDGRNIKVSEALASGERSGGGGGNRRPGGGGNGGGGRRDGGGSGGGFKRW
jgi:cold-inducible RNA-binding protein